MAEQSPQPGSRFAPEAQAFLATALLAMSMASGDKHAADHPYPHEDTAHLVSYQSPAPATEAIDLSVEQPVVPASALLQTAVEAPDSQASLIAKLEQEFEIEFSHPTYNRHTVNGIVQIGNAKIGHPGWRYYSKPKILLLVYCNPLSGFNGIGFVAVPAKDLPLLKVYSPDGETKPNLKGRSKGAYKLVSDLVTTGTTTTQYSYFQGPVGNKFGRYPDLEPTVGPASDMIVEKDQLKLITPAHKGGRTLNTGSGSQV